MKTFIIGCICLFLSFLANAQEPYSVRGESLLLETHIEGDVDLLWGITNGKYRYFLRYKDDSIIELLNTKDNGKFQYEFREVLQSFNTDNKCSADKIDFILYELGLFVDCYNQSQDADYVTQIEEINIQIRFEGFAGLTNSPFVRNPENISNPQLGFSIELIDLQSYPRHALFFNGRHVFKSDKFNYNVTELALGYRFRLINDQKFSVYTDLTFGTLSFLNTTIFIKDDGGNLIEEEVDEVDFNAPLKIGVGMDYRISQHSFITFGYNELVALNLDNRGNFSTTLSLGYKVNL